MASITDKFIRVTDSDTGRPVISTLASSKALGATSVTISDATNWTTTTLITFVIYNTKIVSGVTIKDTTSQTEWSGTLSGTTISNVTLTGGTDQTYNGGASIELSATANWAKRLYDGLMVLHNPDGTLKNNAISMASQIADGTITASKIAAVTADKFSNPYKFSVYRNAAYGTVSAAYTKFPFDAESYDTNNNYDNVTNFRYTAPIAGFYHFTAEIATSGGTQIEMSLYKNGAFAKRLYGASGAGNAIYTGSGGADLQLAANDYVEVWYYIAGVLTVTVGAGYTYFDGHLISTT